MTRTRGIWPRLPAACTLIAALTAVFGIGTIAAQPPQTDQDRQLYNYLRTVINAGADLFNLQRDFDGCYRLYKESLLIVRPLLAHRPKLQQVIDNGVAAADKHASVVDRAFALRKVLDEVRAGLRGDGPPIDKKGKEEPKDKKKETPKDKKKDKKLPPPRTLWDRLGGKENVEKIVDDFIAAAAADPKVDFTRGGKVKVDINRFRKQMIDFLSELSDGPYRYLGKEMKEAHRSMGITDEEFNRTAAHLQKAMQKNGVQPADVKQVMQTLATMRRDIVEPNGKKDKKLDGKDTKKKTDEKDKKKTDEPKKNGGKVEDLTAAVAGRVTLEGKPLPLGYVTFEAESGPAKGRSFSTFIRGEGKFAFKNDLPVGQYRVAVEPAVDPKTNQAVPDAPLPPLPYRSTATSGLRFTVVPGRNELNIELTRR